MRRISYDRNIRVYVINLNEISVPAVRRTGESHFSIRKIGSFVEKKRNMYKIYIFRSK